MTLIFSKNLHIKLRRSPDQTITIINLYNEIKSWINNQQHARRLFKGFNNNKLKFIYSEKATKFCEIFPLLLTVCTAIKSMGKSSQNFVAFSEYMNFNSLFAIIQSTFYRII